MPRKTLHQETAATTIGRLMYGSPAWWGYSSERDLNRLDSFIRRAKRGGFLPDEAPSFRETAAQADLSLFKTLSNDPNHVLRSLCTLRSTIQYHLRPRTHPFNLPVSDNRNFLSCLMFLGTYKLLLLFLYDVSTLTFCINVSHRLIVNGCVLSPMFENKRRYNIIQ